MNEERLRQIIREEIQAALTQRRSGLAVKAGISRITLYTAEKAPQLMTERTANSIAQALGVPVTTLVPR